MQPVIHHITALAGHSLAVYLWPPPPDPTAWVFLSHSFGAYHTRFTSLAHALIKRGYAVCGHDTYGHGLSGGRKADLLDFHTPILDTCTVLDFCRQQNALYRERPLIAFSFGTGSIANSLVATQKLHPIDALIIASPYIKPYKSLFQKLLTRLIPLRWLPFISARTGAAPEKLIHNPEMRRAYTSDPLLYKRIYARSYLYMYDGAKRMQDIAPTWNTPTLMLYTLNDPIVDHTATEAFIKLLPPELVSTHVMHNASHIFFQETDREETYKHIINWLDTRFRNHPQTEKPPSSTRLQ